MIDVESWRPADGLTLETNALRTVKELKYCMVLTAGPGAGKTEMLAQRADFLLRTANCLYLRRILAISFKVDASKNIKERVLRRCGQELASRFDSYTFHGFAKHIIDRFRLVLSGNDSLDLGYTIGDSRIINKQIELQDLIPLAVQILQDSKIARNAVRQTYGDVFLDEFQDCTDQQYKLIQTAFQYTHCRLIAVGDTKQKIMGWAGAMEGIFDKFVNDFSAIPLNLYLNFRSQPKLLRMQNEIIRVLDPGSVMPDEQITGTEGSVRSLFFKDSLEEANAIVDLIEKWITEDHIMPSEIAVLVSKQPDLYACDLMSALSKRELPFRNEQQMQDISAEPITRLIVDYLLCLCGKHEPNAWVRLMSLLTPFANEEIQTAYRQDFYSFFSDQRKKIKSINLREKWQELIQRFLDKIGMDTIVSLSSDYETGDRLQNLLKEIYKKIEKNFVNEFDLSKALENFLADQNIRILTIHKCKGLEFDSVIIMAVDNEIFFGKKADNRCAFFVGVSRAKRRLVLTYSERRERPSEAKNRWDICRTPQHEFFEYAIKYED